MTKPKHHILYVLAALVGFIAHILSYVAMGLPWTTYRVPEELRFEADVMSSDLFRRWPQLHYSRSRQQYHICFHDVDAVTCKV